MVDKEESRVIDLIVPQIEKQSEIGKGRQSLYNFKGYLKKQNQKDFLVKKLHGFLYS